MGEKQHYSSFVLRLKSYTCGTTETINRSSSTYALRQGQRMHSDSLQCGNDISHTPIELQSTPRESEVNTKRSPYQTLLVSDWYL